MDKKQAHDLTDKLRGIFPNTSHFNTKQYQEAWFNFILTLNTKRAYKALETAIHNCKYCPNIAEFKQIYDETPDDALREYLKTDCKVCDGNGFKMMKKVDSGYVYEILAYCDKCAAGANYKYDGQQMERRSLHYTAPISFYGEEVKDEVELQLQDNKFDALRKRIEQVGMVV